MFFPRIRKLRARVRGSWLELVRAVGDAVLGLGGEEVAGLGDECVVHLGTSELLEELLEHGVSFRKFGFIRGHVFPAKAKKKGGDSPTKTVFSNLSCGCTPGGGFTHAFVSR